MVAKKLKHTLTNYGERPQVVQFRDDEPRTLQSGESMILIGSGELRIGMEWDGSGSLHHIGLRPIRRKARHD